jgi:HEAT repeat protein
MALRTAALLLIALGAPQDDPRTLIEQLRSDRAEQRDEAARKLQALGKAAAPALEAAAKDRDSEVASRARQLLRRLSIREMLPRALREGMPNVEDRLVSDGDRAWAEVFMEVWEKAGGLYSVNLLEELAVPALRGAASDAEIGRVIQAISSWGLHAAVPELLQLLQRRNGVVREAAGRALSDLKVRDAVPSLLPLLADPDPAARQLALHALAQLAAREAAPKMLPLLKDEYPGVRQTAADALTQLRHAPAVPGIIALLKEESPRLRQSAIQNLSELGAIEAVPALLPLLRDREHAVRVNAIWTLTALKAREAVPEFLRLLDDEDASIRAPAITALGWVEARETVPRIRELLKDKSSTVQDRAISVLGQLNAKEAIADIVQVVQHDVRSCVGGRAESIAGTFRGLGAAEAAAELLKSMKQATTAEARHNYASLLAAMGAREAIPDLQALLRDPEARVRRGAVDALRQLGVRGSGIRGLLKDEDPSVLIAAIQALGALAEKDAIPDLIPFLEHENSSIRSWTLQALQDLDATEAIPRLIRALNDSDVLTRQRAVRCLGRMGAREPIPALLKCVADEGTRYYALEALDWLEAAEGIPAATALLKHPFSSIRVMAADWLCRRGVRDGAALLIEESRDLTALNALRYPELWRKLRRTPWVLTRQHSSKELHAFLAKEWGVTLEPVPGATDWASVSMGRVRETTTVLEILRQDANHDRCQPILDKDRIRLLPYHEALTFWKQWLAESK